jgi:hypothetical protein
LIMFTILGFCDDAENVKTEAPGELMAYIRRHFKGQHFALTLDAVRRKRSVMQNAYLHAEPFPKLAKAWGESIARTKLICMGEFWGYEPCKVTRQFLPVKVHTSDMTVEECTLFIDWLVPWALMEHGVDVAPPRESELAA